MKKISFITQVIALTVAIPALSIMELKHDRAIQVKGSGSIVTTETVKANTTTTSSKLATVASFRPGV